MATARIFQGDVDVVDEGTAPIRVSQYEASVIFNFPALNVNASQYDVDVLSTSEPVPMLVSQYDVDVVMRGKVYNPNLRAWTFDLDGHEFYVLRLGEDKTLVYDLSTQQWSWWSSSTGAHWRPTVGTNWTNSGSIPYGLGSNVVVGDDTFGTLSILNPSKGVDDSIRDPGEVNPFTRVATAQVMTRGRVTMPCYQLYLVGDIGRPAYPDATVTLSYSDDGGETFTSAGARVVETGNFYQELAWRSLGHIRSPGRIFRIEDDGALPMINELTFYNGTE